MNSLIRFKLALTEDNPTIRPYFEDRWALLPDSANVHPAVQMIYGIHARWVTLLRSLSESQLRRIFFHPGQSREIVLTEAIAMYAWHLRHHLSHITSLKKRM